MDQHIKPDCLDGEFWKPIPEYGGVYQISSFGRLFRNGKILKPLENRKTGYLSYQLCVRGKIKSMLAHRLVAMAFIGQPPNDTECGHLDGNRKNNCVQNLRWMTTRENQRQRIADGTANRGDNAYQATLSIAKVIEIRRLRKLDPKTHTCHSLGKEFGVSWAAIHSAATGRTWPDANPIEAPIPTRPLRKPSP